METSLEIAQCSPIEILCLTATLAPSFIYVPSPIDSIAFSKTCTFALVNKDTVPVMYSSPPHSYF